MALTRLGPNSVNLTSAVTGTLPVANGGTALTSGFVNGGGVTVADQWRLTTDNAMSSSGNTDITANWERNDNSGFAQLGTGMTESSGIFTFPSTGIYLIHFHGNVQKGGSDYIVGQIRTTTNNSTYDVASYGVTFSDGSSRYGSFDCFFQFDVTDTSTHKCAFYQYKQSGNQVSLLGDTTRNDTHFTFLRLGDT